MRDKIPVEFEQRRFNILVLITFDQNSAVLLLYCRVDLFLINPPCYYYKITVQSTGPRDPWLSFAVERKLDLPQLRSARLAWSLACFLSVVFPLTSHLHQHSTPTNNTGNGLDS